MDDFSFFIGFFGGGGVGGLLTWFVNSRRNRQKDIRQQIDKIKDLSSSITKAGIIYWTPIEPKERQNYVVEIGVIYNSLDDAVKVLHKMIHCKEQLHPAINQLYDAITGDDYQSRTVHPSIDKRFNILARNKSLLSILTNMI